MAQDAWEKAFNAEPLDLSNYKTAAGAAKAVGRYLSDRFEAVDGDEVTVKNREETEAYCGTEAWSVVWEAGPYDWAFALTGGEGVFSREYGLSEPEITGFHDGGFHVENYYSFDILFFDE